MTKWNNGTPELTATGGRWAFAVGIVALVSIHVGAFFWSTAGLTFNGPWLLGSGKSIHRLLGNGYRMSFQAAGAPIPMERLLGNRLNVITLDDGTFRSADAQVMAAAGIDTSVCNALGTLVQGMENCLALTNGLPIPGLALSGRPDVRTPVAVGANGLITASPSTFFVPADTTLRIKSRATLSQRSRDGVVVQIYTVKSGQYSLMQSHAIDAGETVEIEATIDQEEVDAAILRISRGPAQDGEGDVLTWSSDAEDPEPR